MIKHHGDNHHGLDLSELRLGELLTTIIGVNENRLPALSLGERIEPEIALSGLRDATLPDLKKLFPGIRKSQFQKLMAAVELGQRVAEANAKANLPRCPLISTTLAISYCRNRFSRLRTDGTQEEFHILTLDTKNRVIQSHRVALGVLTKTLVHPREVFRPAIKDAAFAIIAVHNHPSGDPTPSEDDFKMTEVLDRAGKTLGISLLDHIIVAKDGVTSIREYEASKPRRPT